MIDLLLGHYLDPGDCLMLTAAVRELNLAYPGNSGLFTRVTDFARTPVEKSSAYELKRLAQSTCGL
jgi:hypothetical protein